MYCSLGRRGVRKITRPVHAAHETQHKRLRRTDAQNIRLEAEHERHSMNWTGYDYRCASGVGAGDVKAYHSPKHSDTHQRRFVPPPAIKQNIKKKNNLSPVLSLKLCNQYVDVLIGGSHTCRYVMKILSITRIRQTHSKRKLVSYP